MPTDFDGLVQNLKDEDWETRSKAALLLGKSGNPRAVEPLIDTALHDPYFAGGNAGHPVRKAALKSLHSMITPLCKLGNRQAESLLTSILETVVNPECIYDWNGRVCLASARALIRHFGRSRVSLQSPVILTSDDERDINALICFTLKFAGFGVVSTLNGVEVLELAPLIRPDLILLDVRMPKITGYEVCRQLKESPLTSWIPVAFLSAKGQEAEIKQGLDSGAVEYILKPFAPDELTNKVKGILRRLEMGIYEED